MNLYKCLYCEKVYRTYQSRNAHQGKCESNLLESMPENHEDPRKEVKRINERLETISNVIFRLTYEGKWDGHDLETKRNRLKAYMEVK